LGANLGGLYLEIYPNGRKWWRLKYRFNGKEKRISLGVYPDVTLSNARERRSEARKQLANGIDPSQNRKAQKAAEDDRLANSFEEVAREWFTKFSPSWAPAHAARKIRLFERDIFPWIGQRPIAEIAAPELLSVLRRIEKRGVRETERRALVACGQVFRYAVASARAERDPSGDLRGALPPVNAEHFAAITEPDQLGGILNALDAYRGTLPVRCAIDIVAQRLNLTMSAAPLGEKVSGMLVVMGKRGAIGYNSSHPRVRQRFTISHEIAHYLLHAKKGEKAQLFIDQSVTFRRDENSSAGVDHDEVEANQLGAALLMPKGLVQQEIKRNDLDLDDDEAISLLAKKFQVSAAAMSNRLANLRMLR